MKGHKTFLSKSATTKLNYVSERDRKKAAGLTVREKVKIAINKLKKIQD